MLTVFEPYHSLSAQSLASIKNCMNRTHNGITSVLNSMTIFEILLYKPRINYDSEYVLWIFVQSLMG